MEKFQEKINYIYFHLFFDLVKEYLLIQNQFRLIFSKMKEERKRELIDRTGIWRISVWSHLQRIYPGVASLSKRSIAALVGYCIE